MVKERLVLNHCHRFVFLPKCNTNSRQWQSNEYIKQNTIRHFDVMLLGYVTVEWHQRDNP